MAVVLAPTPPSNLSCSLSLILILIVGDFASWVSDGVGGTSSIWKVWRFFIAHRPTHTIDTFHRFDGAATAMLGAATAMLGAAMLGAAMLGL